MQDKKLSVLAHILCPSQNAPYLVTIGNEFFQVQYFLDLAKRGGQSSPTLKRDTINTETSKLTQLQLRAERPK